MLRIAIRVTHLVRDMKAKSAVEGMMEWVGKKSKPREVCGQKAEGSKEAVGKFLSLETEIKILIIVSVLMHFGP